MREQPDAGALLAIVRQVLQQELLPALPKEQTYKALMMLNALGIAERQWQAGTAPQQAECLHLRQLLALPDAELPTLTRVLAQQVRAGAADHHQELQDFLWQSTVQRVRESAPKALLSPDLV